MPSIKTLLLYALLSAARASAQPTGTTGSLQGTVTDPQGRPVPGAVVRYQSIPASVAAGVRQTPAPHETVTRGAVTTDANGKFSIAGLPPAQHLLCASVSSAPYLDPCIWGQSVRTTVSVGAASNSSLILTKGVYLNVRVNDPMRILPQAMDGPWTPRKLQVGVVYGSGAYHGTQNIAADSNGRTYQLIIPAGQPFRLWLYSTDVKLADGSGSTIGSPAAAIPFQAIAGQDQTFTFTVVGSYGSRAQ